MIEPTKDALERLLADSGGLYSVQDILDRIIDGRMQSWMDGSGTWVVTQLSDFPRKRILEVVFAIGGLAGVHSLDARITEFAKENGASMMLAHGRPGWDKNCAPGWHKRFHYYAKELQP